ncbi:MAG: succinyldiaminopimelate transaminase [Planctomycetota bacterium]|nr:succinyldiaminopimelate transaminase [Planctomycetota bacterium]
MDDRIRQLQTYPMVELARRKAELVAKGIDVLDFGTGDPVEPTAPVIRQALIDSVPEISQYPTIKGLPALREAFSDWYEARFDVSLDPETEVLPSRGSKEAIFHLPLVLVDIGSPKNAIVYPEPGYPVMEIGTLYATAHRVPHALTAENQYLMRPEDVPEAELERARIVWINYPHNPTGTDMPAELFEAWVAARDAYGFVLCSDECYTEIYFGEKPRSLLEFGREGCLVFHSLSKRSGMTGYRSGIIAGDPELLAFYRAQRAAMGQANTEFVQRASVAAWRDEAHVEERRRIFGAKRDVMRAGLESLGLSVYPTSSTFYMWIGVPEGETDASYAARLMDAGIVVSPGSFFGRGNERFFRAALVPSVAGCEEALTRWARL